MLIFSHRCRGFGFKENSIRAVRKALQSRVDGVEVDVRLTRDKKWVVIHNPFYRNEENTVRRIHEHTFSQVRREVVELDAILALYAALGEGKELMIDVKDVGETRQLVGLVRRHGLQDSVVIIAWEPEVLRRVRREAPELRIGLSYVPLPHSVRRFKGVVAPPSKRRFVLSFNKAHSFDEGLLGKTHQHFLSELPDLPLFSIQVPALLCRKRLVSKAHERNTRVVAFTVNRTITKRLLERQGVDGVLTDFAPYFTQG